LVAVVASRLDFLELLELQQLSDHFHHPVAVVAESAALQTKMENPADRVAVRVLRLEPLERQEVETQDRILRLKVSPVAVDQVTAQHTMHPAVAVVQRR
jgi:hypothetical protein